MTMRYLTRIGLLSVSAVVRRSPGFCGARLYAMRQSAETMYRSPQDPLAVLPSVLREWTEKATDHDGFRSVRSSLPRLLCRLAKEAPQQLLPTVLTATVRAGVWRFGAGDFGKLVGTLFSRVSMADRPGDVLLDAASLKKAFLTHQDQLYMSGNSSDLLALCAGILNLNLSLYELGGLLGKIVKQWKGSVQKMSDEQLEQLIAVLRSISLYDDPDTQKIVRKFLPEVQVCLQKRMFRFPLQDLISLATRLQILQPRLSVAFLQRFDRQIADSDLRQLQLADLHSVCSLFVARNKKSSSRQIRKFFIEVLQNGYVDDPSAADHIHDILQYMLEYQEEMFTEVEFVTFSLYIKQACNRKEYNDAALLLSSLRYGSELTIGQRSEIVVNCGKELVADGTDCQCASVYISLLVTMVTLRLSDLELLDETASLAMRDVDKLATTDLVQLLHSLSLWMPVTLTSLALLVMQGHCAVHALNTKLAVRLARAMVAMRIHQTDWSTALAVYARDNLQTLLPKGKSADGKMDSLSDLVSVVMAVVQGGVACEDMVSDVARCINNLCRGEVRDPIGIAKLTWCCVLLHVYPHYALEGLFNLPLVLIKEVIQDPFAAMCLRDLHWRARNGDIYHVHEGMPQLSEVSVLSAVSHTCSLDVPLWLREMLDCWPFQPEFGILTKEGYTVHAAMLRRRSSTKWVSWKDAGLDPSNFTEQQLWHRNLAAYAVRLCPETSLAIGSVYPLPAERMIVSGLRLAGWEPIRVRMDCEDHQRTLLDRLDDVHRGIIARRKKEEEGERAAYVVRRSKW